MAARKDLILLRGECEAETSDGTHRAFGPGDVVLLEDTSGRGHRSWVVGDERLLMAVVELAR